MTRRELDGFREAVQCQQNAPVAYIFAREVQVIGVNDGRTESKIRGMTTLYMYVDGATVSMSRRSSRP